VDGKADKFRVWRWMMHHPSTMRLCASAQKETRISYVATRWVMFDLQFGVIELTIKHSGCISQDHLHGTMSLNLAFL